MPSNAAYAHYVILTSMLAPAFFLTATSSLLMSANNRLARVVDRLRALLKELEAADDDDDEREVLDRRITKQRRRSQLILRGSQLLYIALSCFVATSLCVAIDAFAGYRLGLLPTAFAVLGVLAMFASSLFLSRESTLAVQTLNEEMDRAHAHAARRR